MSTLPPGRRTTRLRHTLFAAALLWPLAGCSTSPLGQPGSHESLNATLWSLTAPEFYANATQAYRAAATNLDAALEDPLWTAALEQQGEYADLPTAVLMDLDQTVLDNSEYNARIVTRYGEYTQETFSEWCREESATAIPGALEFVTHARERGVTVIYYSRRIEPLRGCTTSNLESLGFPVAEEHLFLNDKLPETNKGYLRKELSTQYRILLLVGDDLEDFVSGSKVDPATRRELAIRHSDRWGKEWIILPNPMYGTWDTSLYGHDYGLSSEERLDRKLRYLEQ